MRVGRKLCLCCVVAALGAAALAEMPPFGFSGIEFHKVGWNTHNLRIADINGDGLNDVLLVNNAKAQVECLIQRDELKDVTLPPADAEPNQIPDDPRFESRPFLAQKKIFTLDLGDLNKDGRVDMAYYGDPRELVVVYQDDKGQWGQRRTFDINDGSAQSNGLVIGDVNGDKRNDIVLLARDGTYFIRQDENGKLEAPRKESGLPEGAFAVIVEDFNRDGRCDLLYVCQSDVAPFSFRFQTEGGRLGPEELCKAPRMRGGTVEDVDGDGAGEIVSIQHHSGRLVIYKTATEAPGGRLLEGSLERYALRASGARRSRAVAFGNFSGSGRLDIVVAAPDAAEIELFAQAAPGDWNLRASFPSLQAAMGLGVVDADGDDRPELLVLSPEEPMLGLSKMDKNGRFTFPRALPVVGKPTCMTVADLDQDGTPEIIYAGEKDQKRALHVLARSVEGAYAEKLTVHIEKARAAPNGLLVADANQDGIQDILLFTPYQEMRIFKGTKEGKFSDVSQHPEYGKGLVQKTKLESVAFADVNGDGKEEILLAVKHFARALVLDGKDRLEVIDQFNGRSPSSVIVAVAGADLDGDAVPEIILMDSTNKCLTVLKRNKMGVYEIAENYKTGAISVERLIMTDLTGDQKPELILLGKDDFTILMPDSPRTIVKEVASYETPVKNGRLDVVAVGDLNGDGKVDILVSEITKHCMELLTWKEDGESLRRALNWRVFEAKTYAGSRYSGESKVSSEPREFEIGDVTGDGKLDVVMLIHDRLLLYPQE